ncbi:MAG: hypothetical protein LUG93_14515 [Lachnospiraceae bacterium]|nr:hypothetical protein [Lachnospiraceae bacterium]
MSLTRQDFEMFSKLLDEKFDEKLAPVHEKMLKIDGRLDALELKMGEMQTDICELKGDVSTLKKEVLILKEEVAVLNKRVGDLEKQVAVLAVRLTEVEHRVKSIELCLENEIKRDIRFLAENYLPAATRYQQAETERQKLRNDVDVLNIAVRHHSEDLSILKKMFPAAFPA